MKLKPAKGRAVRDPVKRTLLPADGVDVTLDPFWRRRLRDGDVVEVTTDTTATATTQTTATSTTETRAAASTSADAATTDTASTGATS